MRVLLINANRNRYCAPLPVGLAYLLPPLKAEGHEVEILDLMFARDPMRELKAALAKFKPEMAGFSIRNLDNQSMADPQNPLPEIREYISLARQSGAVTILGGTAFTTLPEAMLAYMGADYGICGQGEKSLPLLLKVLSGELRYHEVPGLVYREGREIIAGEPAINGYADGRQADWAAIDIDRYRRNALWTPPAAVVVKTGCPYGCSFCDVGAMMGRSFIPRDMEAVLAEIKEIKLRYQVRWFFLIDPCFNSPLDYAKELLRRIVAEKLDLRFMTRLNPIPGCFDAEFVRLFMAAGGYFSMMGVDSFCDKMLENYNKPYRLQDIRSFGEMAGKHGLKLGMELLVGGPGESADTVRKSMDALSALDFTRVTHTTGIRIVPRTGIYDTAKSEGIIKAEEDLLFPRFYVSPSLDPDWADRFINASIRRYGYRQAALLPIALRNLGERFPRR